MAAATVESIVLSSDEEPATLADARPPSDDDYGSSITLTSSDEDSAADEEEVEEINEETVNGDSHTPVVVGEDVSSVADKEEPTDESKTTNNSLAVDEENTNKKEGSAKKKRKASPKKKSGEKVKRKRKAASERRNIRKILAENKLDMNTVAAQKEEAERKQRLAERDQLLAERENEIAAERRRIVQNDTPNLKSLLSEKLCTEHKVVELSSSDDDDCCIVLDHSSDTKQDEKEDTSADPENSGIHVDDSKNQPDSEGRVLVNVGHDGKDGDIFLSPQVGRAVKPHQIGGIRFLYDSLVESLERFKNSQGFGCILAHSMGLGKTLQVVAFTDMFMRHTEARRVLIIVPINTLQNWINEFDMWLPTAANSQGIPTEEVTPRSFKLFYINDTHKTVGARAQVIEQWTSNGGVLLLGYEMFRLLATRKTKTRKRRANAGPELIDIDLEEKNSGLQLDMQQALLDPGPDLVICDEGHRIKNSHAGISKSLKQINTKRRVVLTGYPLQNNLTEYWCMVDFVRPNFLGSKVEFSNMFERPISNGQCADSTQQDVKLMKYRAHVLHTLLCGFVQRRNHKVLMNNLPLKQEWVLMIKMSAFQRRIYNMFMEDLKYDTESCIGGTNPLKAFAVACKIWNHPDVMHTFLDKQSADNDDLELEFGIPSAAGLTNGSAAKKVKKSPSEAALLKMGRRDSPTGLCEKNAEISYDWVKPAFADYRPGVLENSGKFVILFQIIEETLRLGEKLLIFSQSLTTLNLLEQFLSRMPIPHSCLNENWSRNVTYFRLDGSTNATERERLVHQFNSRDNKDVSLFLLSTKAGCLGINLIGANRVVVLDASWNPCHDCQAVCRVYRYGQTRPCFIYRFVSDNTLERKIYDRQVNKQGMADRVVDEIQVNNNFSKKEKDQLLEYQDKDLPTIDPTNIERSCSDPVLTKVIKTNHHWVTQNPFTHESLLIEDHDQKLTRAEKRLAKEAGPSIPPSSAPTPAQPSLSTPRLSTPPSIRPPFHPDTGTKREIRPGVTMQRIAAQKDIVVPGPEQRHIKKGELLNVIRTPKGTYIQLSDGKLFAVRNRTDAESFGLQETTRTSTGLHPPNTGTSKQEAKLNSLLRGVLAKHRRPSIVSRRPPHAGVGMNGSPADSQIPTDQPAPTDSSPNFMPMVGIGPPATSNSILPVGMSGMLPGSPSDQSGHMTRVSVGSSSMPMPMSAMPPPSTGNSVMPSSSAGNMLPGDNQHLQRNNSNNSLPSTMNDMHNSMMYSQYPTNSQTSASSYEFPQANYFGSSQCQESAEYGMYAPRGYLPHNQFNRYPWPGHQPSPRIL
ncbi:RAD54L2 [Bugula neritina]|uniref:RAD54L2 n=1 Tax=Bugula neritina TaxID=10212 RepID=A0A7J7J8Z5_BUGNE|nr:RAD54L2 [Bugula neritina]